MIRRLTLSIALTLCLFGSGVAQTPIDYREFNFPEVGRLQLQKAIIYDLEVVGSHAYAAMGDSGVAIIDVSNPEAPVQVATIAGLGAVLNLDVTEDGVLWATALNDGLHGFAIEADGGLTPLAVLTGIGEAHNLTLNGNTAYVGTRDQGLQVVDVSTPSAPTVIGTLDAGGSCNWLACLGDVVYARFFDIGLAVVDVSVPASPTIAQILDTPINVATLTVVGDRLYHSGGYDLWAWDLADPLAPVLLGATAIGMDLKADLVVQGTTTYVAGNNMGLIAVDWSDPATAAIVASSGRPFYGTSCAWLGDRVLTGDYFGTLRVFQTVEPRPNPRIAQLELDKYSLCMARSGDLLAMGCNYGRFELVDLSDPSDPRWLSGLDLPFNPEQLFMVGDLVAVRMSFGYDNLQLVDISDPVHPVFVEKVPYRELLEATVWNDNLVAIDSHRCLVVFDMSNPAVPLELGRTETLPEYVLDLEVVGDVVWAIYAHGGLTGIDLSDPTAPVIVSYLPEAGEMGALLYVDGSLLATALTSLEIPGGIQVINVSDPQAPELGAFVPMHGLHGYSLTRAGDVLYAGDWYGGFLAFDVSDPTEPIHLSGFTPAGPSFELLAFENESGTFLLSASGPAGLEVYPLQILPGQSSSPSVQPLAANLRAYPNPFNPACVLSFELPRAERVFIDVFDVKGCRVANLAAGELMPAGPHQVTWRGMDAMGQEVASGLYFALLDSPSVQAVQKLMLVR